MNCSSCGKPAFFIVQEEEGHEYYLCIDCNLKQEAAEVLERQRDVQALNFALGAFEAMAGVRLGFPRMQVSAVPPMSYTNMTNINVDRSVVGVINTGTIHSLNNSVTALRDSGETALANHVRDFTQAVLDSCETSNSAKQQIAEIMDAIAAEAARPKTDRRPAVIRPLIGEIAGIVGGVAALSQLWETYGPMLLAYFN